MRVTDELARHMVVTPSQYDSTCHDLASDLLEARAERDHARDEERCWCEAWGQAARERDEARAEVERLTGCLTRANANMEEVERSLYLKLGACEAGAERLKREIGALLATHGCDCDCGHGGREHDADCVRCLACRVGAALGGKP